MPSDLLTQESFNRLAALALAAGTGDDVVVSVSESDGGTTRFANNQVTQNVHTRRRSVAVTAAFGQQRGSASTTDFSDDAVRDCVRRAEAVARAAPADPEHLPALSPQKYPLLASYRPETAAAGPERRLAAVREAIERCAVAKLEGAGIVSSSSSAEGVAAKTGLAAFERRTEAAFSLTATGPDSTGWVSNASRSFDDLGVTDRTQAAIEKAQRSAKPREIPAGRYTVILEPAAVAGLLGPLIGALDAKSYYKSTSPVAGKLGQPLIDPRLSLRNRPDHPQLLGDAFNSYGLPSDMHTWIDRGVLARLSYDRFTAQEHGVEPTFGLDAPYFWGENTAANHGLGHGPETGTSGGATSSPPNGSGAVDSIDELIRGTRRGVLVTNFWYIRGVNPTDLTLTGMTRDGTFLIEDGHIASGLIHFRWHDSPLRVFNAVEAYTRPMDAITMERGKMLLPAMRIRDFNFSSVTRF
ncbi:MAG: TldD/PmbA family protein [Phycisphaerae bacterium]